MTDMAAERPGTVRATIDLALGAYEDLVSLGEDVEDEWTYVTDLAAAWRERLDEVRSARADEVVPADVANAVVGAAAEVARIRDPHRAIDWLSTYPQVVLLALGDEP